MLHKNRLGGGRFRSAVERLPRKALGLCLSSRGGLGLISVPMSDVCRLRTQGRLQLLLVADLVIMW